MAAAVGANGVIEHIVRFLHEAIREQGLRVYPCATEDKDIEDNTPVDIALSERREELALCFLSAGPGSGEHYLMKAIDNQCHSVVNLFCVAALVLV